MRPGDKYVHLQRMAYMLVFCLTGRGDMPKIGIISEGRCTQVYGSKGVARKWGSYRVRSERLAEVHHS